MSASPLGSAAPDVPAGRDAVLAEVRAESLTERVFEAIRTAIVTKGFPPGAPLREATLAKQLNVSKTPVREALLRLRTIGLIEPDGRRGGRVIRPSRDRLTYAYEVREALEVFTTRTAATQGSGAQKREIAHAASESLIGAKDGGLATFSRWDAVFHARITEVAANPRMTELLDDAFALIVALRTRDAPDREVSIECGHNHVAVAEAILASQPDVAERRMREHVRFVKDFVIEALSEAPDDAEPDREGPE